MEFEELGFGNRDAFCPHCGMFYEEDELEKIFRSKKKIDSGAVNVKNGSNALEIFLSMAILSTT